MNAVVRSILFVPGDSERKIEKSRASSADALVLDLEDSVASARKSIAREMTAAFLKDRSLKKGAVQWVRINPVNTPEALQDLAAVVAGGPACILQPKVGGPADVRRLSFYLDAFETREGVPIGTTKIVPVVTETPNAPFSLGAYASAGLSRLYGLTWGAEDLSAAMGAATNRDADGGLALTYRIVRSLTLLAAKACGVEAVDTVYPDYRNLEALKQSCLISRREGFSGRFAVHPDQVEAINEAFSPSVDDVAFAERVVAAFAASDAGVVGVDGMMLDKPHLTQAEKVLAMRDAFGARQ